MADPVDEAWQVGWLADMKANGACNCFSSSAKETRHSVARGYEHKLAVGLACVIANLGSLARWWLAVARITGG